MAQRAASPAAFTRTAVTRTAVTLARALTHPVMRSLPQRPIARPGARVAARTSSWGEEDLTVNFPRTAVAAVDESPVGIAPLAYYTSGLPLP